jgi:hypothetical protein
MKGGAMALARKFLTGLELDAAMVVNWAAERWGRLLNYSARVPTMQWSIR